jgi:hypothetical protein
MTILVQYPIPIVVDKKLESVRQFLKNCTYTSVPDIKNKDKIIYFSLNTNIETIIVEIRIPQGTQIVRNGVKKVGDDIISYINQKLLDRYGTHSKQICVYFTFF